MKGGRIHAGDGDSCNGQPRPPGGGGGGAPRHYCSPPGAPRQTPPPPRTTPSPPLAGEPRRDSVHAQEERQLAAVEQVVLHDMPDDPSARQVNALAVPVVGEGLSHLVGTPA